MNTQLSGLLRLTFRELWARKTILALFVISTLIWVLMALFLDPEAATLPARLEAEFGPQGPPQDFLMQKFVAAQAALVVGVSYWGGIGLALFAVVPLLTGLLNRGRVELLLSKPISRPRLLAGHILGVLLLMLFLACYLIGSVWLVLGLKTSIWNTRFLLTIPLLVGMFAVIYGAVVLVNVFVESTALSLIVAFALIIASVAFRGDAIILPEFAAVGSSAIALASDASVEGLWPAVARSFVFGAVCYGIAVYGFAQRDF